MTILDVVCGRYCFGCVVNIYFFLVSEDLRRRVGSLERKKQDLERAVRALTKEEEEQRNLKEK